MSPPLQNCYRHLAPRRAVVLLSALAVAVAASSGCVQRRLMIRSNPPGASVYVDDYPIGVTPVAHNFTYYGTRKIRLVKDDCETLTVYQPIPTPWYQIPPLDFVTETLVPGELRDRRVVTYQLTPKRIVPPRELLGRAEELRARTAPPPAAPPAPSDPSGTGGMPVHALPPGAR
ncbi:MAG: PEGA domain-containing protein [Pirellulales bacterium]|nr:PEGA domain-containing protein [Pirellulales bacterium]